MPKQEDLNVNLAVEGNKMKIEPEPVDMFGVKPKTVKSPPKINKK